MERGKQNWFMFFFINKKNQTIFMWMVGEISALRSLLSSYL
jgi:hypothetical protein